MPRPKFLLAAILAVGAALTTTATSDAGFTVVVSDGTNTVTFRDTGVKSDGDGATDFGDHHIQGTLSLDLAAGGKLDIQINANTNAPGVDGLAQITNQTVEIRRAGPVGTTTSTGATTLTITVLSDGSDSFVLNPTHGNLTTTLNATTLKGSASAVSNINGSPVVGSGVAVAPGNLTNTSNAFVNYSNPFSFGSTMVLHLNASSGTGQETLSQIEVDSTIAAAPAPAGLVMLAGALPFAGLLRLRRRKSEPAIAV